MTLRGTHSDVPVLHQILSGDVTISGLPQDSLHRTVIKAVIALSVPQPGCELTIIPYGDVFIPPWYCYQE